MPEGIGDDSAARSARAGRRPACGPVAGAGAAQTRQIVHPDARDRGSSHLASPGDRTAHERALQREGRGGAHDQHRDVHA